MLPLRRERENLISSLNNSGELAQSDGERECDVTVFNTSVYKPVEKGTLPKANFYAAHDVWHNAPSGVRNTFAMRDSRRLIVDIGRVSAVDDAQETQRRPPRYYKARTRQSPAGIFTLLPQKRLTCSFLLKQNRGTLFCWLCAGLIPAFRERL